MTAPHVFMDFDQFRSFHPTRRTSRRGWLILAGLAAVFAPRGLRAQAPVPPELQNPRTTLSIRADSQEKNQNTYLLRGHVEVSYQEMKLTANEATFDESSGELTARGQVVFTDPDIHLEADEAHYNVQSKKGWFKNGHGYMRTHIRPRPRMLVTENPFFFQAARVDRLDPWTYTIQGGRLTTCDCEAKGWSVAARRARVEVDHQFVARDATFRLLRIPLFYFPVLINSIAEKPRKTGFLLPHIGNSSQKGFIVGDAFYWAINPSMDLLLGLENYSVRGVARRGVFSARPSESSDLTVDYFGVNDKGGGPQRQFRAPGQSLRMVGKARDLAYGFRGVLDVDYITSLAFRLTFAENFTQAVSSEVHQSGFLTRNWDAYSLNFFASRYQNFFSATTGPGNSIAIRQTPSVSFSGMDRQVGNTPFYFSFESSAGALGRSEPGLDLPAVSERLDFHPQITLRSKPFWGFHLTPVAGFRSTRYGASLKPGHEPFTRLLGEFSLDLRPPSLEKVFAATAWGHRFKHVMEPDIRYNLVRARNAGDITDVVRYDEVDIFAETNEIEYSLTNTLLARRDVPAGTDKPQAGELISWRLSQKYYFDPTFGGALTLGQRVVFDPTISLSGFAFGQGRRLSPVVSVIKFSPFSNYDTELRADFAPNGGGVLNAGITSHVHRGPLGLAFTDFFINRTAGLSTPLVPNTPLSQLPSFNLLRTVATFGNVSRKGFNGAFGLDYNFARKISQQGVGQLSYNFGCFALDFEYRRLDLGPLRRENMFRVALSLANVGTFGNLKPRERLY